MVFRKAPGEDGEFFGMRVVAIKAVDESGREWPMSGPGFEAAQAPEDFGYFAVRSTNALSNICGIRFQYEEEA